LAYGNVSYRPYLAACYQNYSVPVAGLTFNYTHGIDKVYHLGYYEKNKIIYENFEIDEPFSPVGISVSSFLLDVVDVSGKYIDSYQSYRKNYDNSYLIEGFPMAFVLLSETEASKEEYDNDSQTQFIFEKPTHHITGFNLQKVLKKQAKHYALPEKDRFCLCNEKINRTEEWVLANCSIHDPIYPYEFKDSKDLPFYNVGDRRHFQKTSAYKKALKTIFKYDNYQYVARFAMTNIIIQVIAMVLVGALTASNKLLGQ